MNYEQGIIYMKALTQKLKADGCSTGFLRWGNLIIRYPGYKQNGDYRLSENGKAPKHESIVQEIYNLTNENNFNSVVQFLDDVYLNGLSSASVIFPQAFKEKLFWITLQEELNYPQPKYAGRRLSFQRFYEAALARKGICTLQDVFERTNNHGKSRPVLYKCDNIKHPSFYF